jgi:hypothetical protein
LADFRRFGRKERYQVSDSILDPGAIRWAFDQINKEHIALSHQWCAVVGALGLDANAINIEAIERL